MSICGGLFSLASCNMTSDISDKSKNVLKVTGITNENTNTHDDNFQNQVSIKSEASIIESEIDAINSDDTFGNIFFESSNKQGFISKQILENDDVKISVVSKESYAKYIERGKLMRDYSNETIIRELDFNISPIINFFDTERMKIITDDAFGIIISGSSPIHNDELKIINVLEEDGFNTITIEANYVPSSNWEAWSISAEFSLPKNYENDVFAVKLLTFDYPEKGDFEICKSFMQDDKNRTESFVNENYISIPFSAKTSLRNASEEEMNNKLKMEFALRNVNDNKTYTEFQLSFKSETSTKTVGLDAINIYDNYNEFVFQELENIEDSDYEKYYVIQGLFRDNYFDNFNENETIITILK